MERIDLFRAYFFDETKYYVDKLVKYENGNKNTFNFYAGFFGISWFMYRKMYKEGLILFFVSFPILFSNNLYFNLNNFNSEINFLFSQILVLAIQFTIFGFIGNRIYIRKVIKIIKKVELNNDIKEIPISKLNELKLKGCPSYTPVFIFIGSVTLIYIIVMLKFLG